MQSKKISALSAVLFFVTLWSGGDARTVCPTGWTRHDQSCYLLIGKSLTWLDAQEVCEVLEGNLVTISNSAENIAVAALLESAGEYQAWIGLHDFAREGTFQWVASNREAAYTSWNKGEPNNAFGKEGCVVIRRYGHGWNDFSCDYPEAFICELSL